MHNTYRELLLKTHRFKHIVVDHENAKFFPFFRSRTNHSRLCKAENIFSNFSRILRFTVTTENSHKDTHIHTFWKKQCFVLVPTFIPVYVSAHV